jgi:hypothetical protein
MPRSLSAAAILALACLAACGTGDRQRDAEAVVERFGAALESDDGRAACRELTEEAASTLARQEQAPCEEAILRLDLPSGTPPVASRVYLQSASVDLRGGEVTFLDEGAAGWKVSAAGCTPAEPGRPYDCELEG